MDKLEQAMKNFIAVRDSLHSPETMQAYRLAYSKPMRLFFDNDIESCIQILKEEAAHS